MAEAAVRVRITGRVQGVWYRGWTVKEARARGLAGWVRNRPDGSVEAVFAGPRSMVEAMLEACRHGPPAARVAEVDAVPLATADIEGLPARFEQRDME